MPRYAPERTRRGVLFYAESRGGMEIVKLPLGTRAPDDSDSVRIVQVTRFSPQQYRSTSDVHYCEPGADPSNNDQAASFYRTRWPDIPERNMDPPAYAVP